MKNSIWNPNFWMSLICLAMAIACMWAGFYNPILFFCGLVMLVFFFKSITEHEFGYNSAWEDIKIDYRLARYDIAKWRKNVARRVKKNKRVVRDFNQFSRNGTRD